MKSDALEVSIVVNREYGPGLRRLLDLGSVWVIESSTNREWAERIWEESPKRGHPDGLTLFKAARAKTSEDALVGIFETVDLHHGEYSADPPYTVVHVVGTAPTERVREEFKHFGFDTFSDAEEGFDAVRPQAACRGGDATE
jgi:hypothetical protein